MQLVKNRIINNVPIRTYTDDNTWHPDKHALLYIFDDNKLGSSGDQVDARELGAYSCIVKTHQGYSKRSEFKDHTVEWLFVDISKITVNRTRKNKQYDKDVHEMIMDLDPKVSISKHNSDALTIAELDKNGDVVDRLLTQEEYLNYCDTLFNDSITPTPFPLDLRQQKMVDERKVFVDNNNDAQMIIHIESNHTRAGKDKTNYKGIQKETQVVFDFSGYFATWQITDEFDPRLDHPVYTRGKNKEQILQEIIDVLKKGKRVWVMISTYNDEDSDRIDLLNLFKDANIEIIIDEVDYQVWKQKNLIKGIVANVIA